ncbi:MAG: DUF4249 family protein [Calditrichia bacterium]|nr:DUF4249 family protein [Calditrichia bacterium]
MKTRSTFYVVVTLIFILLMLGCENTTEYEYVPQLTVNGELKAGFPIDSISLTWSADIAERYDTPEQLVSNADVRINGMSLAEYENYKGFYYYPDTTYLVQSGETYRLEIDAGSDQVYSETTVPEPFQFIALEVSEGDTVQYIPGTSWFSEEFFNLVWPGYSGSLIYRVLSLAEEATPENFIEDDRTEAEVFKGEKEDRLNPGMWWVADEYARINWMFFNWTGWHQVVVSAMDSNYYEYRSGILFGEQGAQNFNQIVEGGLGLFCSSASDTIHIFLVE